MDTLRPPPPDPEQQPSKSSQATNFTFVLDPSQQGVRSHAMREYWRQRRTRHQDKRLTTPQHRQLLPNTPGPPSSQSSQSSTSENAFNVKHMHVTHHQQLIQFQFNSNNTPAANQPMTLGEALSTFPGGIPTQILTGVNRALACSQLDPFDMFPVKLTAQHHKLLHHWLSTHATMMFEELPTATFNPMRDVWFPLDLSNAASFNAIMAHAAAHLSRMHGIKNSNEALKYKAEAVRIVRLWMNDPKTALSDEVIAAVIRLLTFERYWGTEAEWRVHRDGLQHMIEARGGMAALQSNWRLELVTYLISLMSKPSWFDSSNNIFELSGEPAPTELHPVGSLENLRRVRCLWLISFIQDMRTFLTSSPEISTNGLRQYTAVRDAISLLRTDMKRHPLDNSRESICSDHEFARLACLFFISVLLQGSALADGAGSPHTPVDLVMMDIFLQSRDIWSDSVESLHAALFHNFAELLGSPRKTNYVLQMTNVLVSLSSEARRGVENCLLHILCQDQGDEDGILFGDWTPDSLLSSLRGL